MQPGSLEGARPAPPFRIGGGEPRQTLYPGSPGFWWSLIGCARVPVQCGSGCRSPTREGHMVDLRDFSIWLIVDFFRNPLGTASALAPGEETPKASSAEEALQRKEECRAELRRRGLSDEDLAKIEVNDLRPVTRLLREHSLEEEDVEQRASLGGGRRGIRTGARDMSRIVDVAKQAGVGVSTVSRVLNDRPHVSDETRARVEAAIRVLDYQPNAAARALSSGRTTAVCLVAPTLGRPETAERLVAVVEGLRDSDFDLVVTLVETTDELEEVIVSRSKADRASGMILVDIPIGSQHVARLRDGRVPVVSAGTCVEGVPSVYVDAYRSGCLATEHLLDLGHRRVTLVQRAQRTGGSVAGRRQGYLDTLEEHDIQPAIETVTDPGRAEDAALVERIISVSLPPTAIVATSDDLGFGVLEAARGLGVEIPEDLSLVGSGDLAAARYVGLTTVRERLAETGALAARLLLSLIEGGVVEAPDRELPAELVTRRTTAPQAP